ncbi:MAG TPA: hypothetical protein VFF69_12875 [Phycisphaerales bacterium]|nr:hypothetical protein [Phycisphaerales bacterium]
MRWMEWRSIGHVPAFCFQCREARSHELLELNLRRRRWLRVRSVPYGHERRCCACGLRSTIDPSAASIRQGEVIAEPEAALRAAYGDDCFACVLIARQRDLEVGLLDADSRFDMLVRTFLAIGNHGDMPASEQSMRSRFPTMAKFAAGVVLALGVGLAADALLTRAHGLALPAALPIFFTAGFCILHSTEGRRLRKGLALRRLKHDVAERLAAAVGPLSPSGFELREAHRLAAERKNFSAMLDPEDLLLRLGGVASGGARAAAASAVA